MAYKTAEQGPKPWSPFLKMDSKKIELFSNNFVILKPKEATLRDVFMFMILPSGSKKIKNLIDCPESEEHSHTNFKSRWNIFASILQQKFLLAAATPIAFSAAFRSLTRRLFSKFMIGDFWRVTKSSDIDLEAKVRCKDWKILDLKVNKNDYFTYYGALTMMASQLAYQDGSPVGSVIRSVVNGCWKMNLLGCYNFWNDFQNKVTTHAFTFQNTATDPNVTIVAFRGTDSLGDWKENINISWYDIKGIGHIHDGYMQALGLQKYTGWPKDLPPGSHEFAYYTLRQALRDIVKANDKARFIFTGHSLGGALATLFVTILAFHGESELLQRLQAVYTFGQPRVGDYQFAQFMENAIEKYGFKYYRYVYSFDIVPRLPFDITRSSYKHFGKCVYFTCFYKGKFLEKEPDGNYILQFWWIPYMYGVALYELVRSIIVPIFKGVDYFEGFFSLMVRVLGLLVPGLSAHICPNYVNSTRYGKIQTSKDIETLLVDPSEANY